LALAYWQLTPQLDAGITYQTNPRYLSDAEEAFNPDGAEDTLGTFVDVRAEGLYKTSSDEASLAARTRRTDYLKSNEDLNNSDSYLNFSATHTGSRGDAGLAAGYQETAVVTSEFQSATPENPDDPPPLNGGTGRYSNATQTTWDFQPSLKFQLSQRNAFNISGEFSDTTYDQERSLTGPATGYFDYNYSSVQLALRHYLNPKNSFVLALNGGNFLSSAPDEPFENSTDSFGVTAAYDHTFTETLTGNVTVGIKRSSVDVSGIISGADPLTGFPCTQDSTCSISNEARNFVGNVALRKRSEETTLNFSLGRAVAPGSNGTEVVQDTMRFYVDRTLTRKLTGSVGTLVIKSSALSKYFQRDSPVIDRIRQDSTYYSIDSHLSWRLTETLLVYGAYTYNYNESDVIGGNGNVQETNNLLFFGVQYRGVGLRR
jgi:hypothetical protein